MAPITTAGLSTSSPRVAITVEVVSNTKNDRLGKEDSTLSPRKESVLTGGFGGVFRFLRRPCSGAWPSRSIFKDRRGACISSGVAESKPLHQVICTSLLFLLSSSLVAFRGQEVAIAALSATADGGGPGINLQIVVEG